MLGLAVYTLLSLGLGAWLPALNLGRHRSIGALLLGGYALMLAAIFLFHVGMHLSLALSVWMMVLGAGAGLVRLLRCPMDRQVLAHPACLVLLLGAVGIVINGGIDYLPYTVDEFTNWIGVSREIHLHGGYDAIRDTVHLPAYTPGWRLALVLPWQIFGDVVLGDSAAAPFVFHVGLVSLFFDIVRHEVDRVLPAVGGIGTSLAWGGTLLYLAAEGTGKLWPYNLLIEQPQIYAFTAVLFCLFLLDGAPGVRRNVLMLVGLLTMGGYLLKMAALTFIPGLGLMALVLFLRESATDRILRIRGSAIDCLLLFGPVFAVAAVWKVSIPEGSQGCMSSLAAILTADSLARAASLDWADLLNRFSGTVASYTVGYKTPILAAALAGTGLAVWMRRTTPLLVFVVFALVYFVALYWYHLACWGPYYFEHLNSIERFSRVVVQPFHAFGLLALSIGVLRILPHERLEHLVARRIFLSAFAFFCVVLFLWQGFQVRRSVEDVTARSHQGTDFRIGEVRDARNFIMHSYARNGEPPLVLFISQGTDADLLGYAKFYALDGNGHEARQLFHYVDQVSWSPRPPTNIWQRETSDHRLRALFVSVDLIWPIVTDPWIDGILHGLVAAPGCPDPLVQDVLVKASDGTFICRRKRAP